MVNDRGRQLWEVDRHGVKDQKGNYSLGWHPPHRIWTVLSLLLGIKTMIGGGGCGEKKVHFDEIPIKRTINWALNTHKALCLMMLRKQG